METDDKIKDLQKQINLLFNNLKELKKTVDMLETAYRENRRCGEMC